jgi:hypothetical protein
MNDRYFFEVSIDLKILARVLGSIAVYWSMEVQQSDRSLAVRSNFKSPIESPAHGHQLSIETQFIRIFVLRARLDCIRSKPMVNQALLSL